MRITDRLTELWTRASLVHRFAVAGGVVMMFSAAALGLWVSDRIAQGTMRQSAINSAHFVETVIAPIVEDLEKADSLSPGAIRALEEILAAPPLVGRVVSFKIWKHGGRIVFATNPALIGQTFPPSPSLRAAWAGEVSAKFDDLSGEESAGEAMLGKPLAEIYTPVVAVWSGEIVAVIEFYEVAEALAGEIAAARRTSWMLVASVTIITGASLLGIVGAGSRTIERQRALLRDQVDAQQRLALSNQDLRRKVQRASAGAAETNERYLGRIGADLHDGPAQLLSLAALRLDSIEAQTCPEARSAEIEDLRHALRDAMGEIRNISRGLSLPGIEGRSVAEVVRRAAEIHMALTRTEVELDLPEASPRLAHPQLIAVYRFVQEGLSNATRHAGGEGMAIAVLADGDRVRVRLSDQGPGMNGTRAPDGAGLGLRGLAERIESLGGDFAIETGPHGGVALCLQLAANEEPGLA
jgi:signal transduction histidine kinase